MSDTTPELTADERLTQIRDRNRRLLAVPFETHGDDVHGPGCPACELVRAIADVQWLLERLEAERATADDPIPYHRWLTRNLGAAYAAGWETHAELVTGTLATLSHDKREQCSRAWIAERLADLIEDEAEQQPEDGTWWYEDGCPSCLRSRQEGEDENSCTRHGVGRQQPEDGDRG